MALTFRDVKGSALDKEEADANVRDLDGRITTLQSGASNAVTKSGTPLDDQIAVWTGAQNLEGTTALSFANAIFRVISTDSTNVVGPALRLWRQSSSPDVNDNLGEVIFEGRNTNTENIVYARIHSEIAVATDGQEAGRLIFLLPLNVGGVVAERDLLKLGPTAEMALISADTAAAIGPVFVLDRTSTSPAAADNLGQVTFRGRDSLNGTVDYATIKGVIADALDGSEDGSLEVQISRAGAMIPMLQVTANGVEVPTGILKLPAGATGSRPLASTVPAGSSFYDTTLGIPIWSNGTHWYTAEAMKPFVTAISSPTVNTSGGSWRFPVGSSSITGIPITNGWNALYLNVSGSNKTITPASGTCIVIESGATAASISVANNKAVTVIGDGTNLIVFGDVV